MIIKQLTRQISNRSLSTSSKGLSMSLVDFSLSHADFSSCKNQHDMVNALVQSKALRSDGLIQAFSKIDRALCIPTGDEHVARYSEPYTNAPQKLFHGATISAPHHHAIVAELANENISPGSKVLDYGCGTGYLTAVFSQLVGPTGTVIGADRIPSCVDFANKLKNTLPINSKVKYVNATCEEANDEIASIAPFDVIHLGFAVPSHTDNDLESPIIQYLTGLLDDNGILVVAIDSPDEEQQLKVLKRGANGEINSKTVMNVLCQAMEPGLLDENQLELKSVQEQQNIIGEQLKGWKADFEAEHKRPPTREDIANDETAKSLFARFAFLRRKSWD